MSHTGIAERLLCLLFPARCLLCGRITRGVDSFCGDCITDVPKEPLKRTFNLNGNTFDVLSALPYQSGFRKTLHRYKFKGERALSGPIGRLMAELISNVGEYDCVAWAAMSKNKKHERGYDQSELLAKAVAKSLRLPCVPLIEKIRETDTQHELPREKRISNIKNAYRASGAAAGRSVILVDDIVTTGSTICECAEELYRAGAKAVLGLCAADTPCTEQEEAEK